MPELPEVETVKNALINTALHKTITKIILYRDNIRYPMPKNLITDFHHQKIVNIHRIGKYVLCDMYQGDSLLIHLGMSGSIRIEKHLLSPLPKHCHVTIHLDDDTILHYIDPRRFGIIDIVPQQNPALSRHLQHMGRDPFSNQCHADYLYAALQKRRSHIKSALLDQSIIAGIGNIYACEILWQSALSPLQSCHMITIKQCEDIVKNTRNIYKKLLIVVGLAYVTLFMVMDN